MNSELFGFFDYELFYSWMRLISGLLVGLGDTIVCDLIYAVFFGCGWGMGLMGVSSGSELMDGLDGMFFCDS